MKETLIKGVYHGTDVFFEKFDFKVGGTNFGEVDSDGVVYATDLFTEAKQVAHPVERDALIMEFDIVLKNPMIVDGARTEKQRSFGKAGYSKLIRIARENKCDSVIIKNIIDYSAEPQTTYILFKDEQIVQSSIRYLSGI